MPLGLLALFLWCPCTAAFPFGLPWGGEAGEGGALLGSGGKSALVLRPPPRAPDAIVRATMQVKRQVRSLRGKQADAPSVTRETCSAAAEELGALACSLVTQISGYPEGCECRLMADKCPPADEALGFTGVSPSTSFSLPQMAGSSVILCMYWQWLPRPDDSAAVAASAARVKKMATDYVRMGYVYSGSANNLANTLWAVTPPPPVVTTPVDYAPLLTTFPPLAPAPAVAGAPAPAGALSPY